MVIARLLSNLTSEESVLAEAEIIIILLGVTLIVALTSRRLRLPYTLLLVLVGLVIGIEIGETHYTNSFPSILWALVGVIIGRVLMIYLLIPLHDLVSRRLENRTFRKQETQRFLPLPHSIPSTWRPLLLLSGLRGALSIALVLSLPTILSQGNLLIDTVFGVVLVTLLGQGLGLRILLPRWPKEETSS